MKANTTILEKDFPVEYIAWQRKLQRQKTFKSAKSEKTATGNKMTLIINTDDEFINFEMRKNRSVILYKALENFPQDTYRLTAIHALFSAGTITITSEIRN